MDRTSIIVLVVCLLVLMLWWPLLNKIFPPKALPPGSTNAPAAKLVQTNAPGTSTVAAISLPAPTNLAANVIVNTNIPEQLIEKTNETGRYTFTSYGGGLQQVEVMLREQKRQTNHGPILNSISAAPTLALLDGEGIQGDGIFELTPTANGVRAEKSLTNGLPITKQ